MAKEHRLDSAAPKPGGAATLGIHGGAGDRRSGAPVVSPVVRSSTFHWAGPSDGAEVLYTRYGNNPVQVALAKKLAALEGAESALALASGMAAIAMTVLSATEAGDHVVSSRLVYGATHVLFAEELPKRGVSTTFVDPLDPSSWEAAVTRRTKVVYAELPTNPALRVFDLEPARRAADKAGAVLAADVTFATPVNFRAADHGVDAVLHSATKYLGGHSDLVAGVVAGSRDLIAGVARAMKLYGPSIDPDAAWLLDRGVRTLAARMERHNRSAQELAEWLEGAEGVRTVLYPGLASHPDHAAARRLLSGFGGMVSVALDGGGEAADRFCSALELATPAPSLGGVETLVSEPRHTSHAGLTSAEREAAGIPDGMVRISVGLEDVDDLKADFAQALRWAHSGRAAATPRP